MLGSHATWKFERPFHEEHDAAVDEPLAAYFEAAGGAFSPNTERALRADVQVFAAWCRRHFRAAFPASAPTVAAFVDEMAGVRTPATVRRYVSSIGTLHKALGRKNPLESARVRFALQRMHRRRGRRQAQVQGLTWPLRNRMLRAAGGRLIDARDRALLAVGYDTLLRRSELVSLQVTDLLEEIDGTATLLVRSGKTDPEGRGAMLYLARDTVQLLNTWLARGGVDGGRLFRSVRKDGTVGDKLDASQVPAHLQDDGPARRTSRRHRGPTGRAQHARRGGAGHDRQRHRAAGHPAVRALAERAHGPALRGAAAGAAQRRRAAGRAAAALRTAGLTEDNRAVTPPAAAGGRGRAPAARRLPCCRSRKLSRAKNVSAPHSDFAADQGLPAAGATPGGRGANRRTSAVSVSYDRGRGFAERVRRVYNGRSLVWGCAFYSR